ncbi:obg family GTPase CgtA [Batrachochytrium dendrobatidis JEL423]|uniref:Obg family GTPase CgtA n=1 Tax=Batrachochytrium dendrobatidis (strain JEL423) TaxID=403673 RepID=A0A177WGU6_BATDL|nr:obg family GTPase CgtA [Batrachochytrium dendrobatidis JEL423]
MVHQDSVSLVDAKELENNSPLVQEQPIALQSKPLETSSLEPVEKKPTQSTVHKFLGKGSPFVDFKYIKVCAGNGGDGTIAFLKGLNGPIGPPAGGNGGRGGNIYITASKNITSLNNVLNRYMARSGSAGMGKQMHGHDGEDLDIVVPVGTLVKEVYTSSKARTAQLLKEKEEDRAEREATKKIEFDEDMVALRFAEQIREGDLDEVLDEELIAQFRAKRAAQLEVRSEARTRRQMKIIGEHFKFRENYVPQEDRMQMLFQRLPQNSKQAMPSNPIEFELLEDGERKLVVRGGAGGLGNTHFVTPTIPGPGIAGRGVRVEPIVLQLELKTMADAGLVGLPNAGKSTLLKATSNAHPKIAPYPFTTLNPYVGTIDFEDFWTMTIADIPGIIKGAHDNLGLGHRFLRHIERTKLLVYVIDLAGEAPWDDLATLQNELEAFQKDMTDRPSLIAANKADISEISKQNFAILKSKTKIPIVPISAKHEKNIRAFTGVMRKIVEEINRKEAAKSAVKTAEKNAVIASRIAARIALKNVDEKPIP